MGCFLACFGFTKKRKRRNSCTKIISEDQSYGWYVPLDFDASSVKLDYVDVPEASATKFSEKPKESVQTKKKVSFNMNVKIYEALPSNDEIETYLSEGEEKKTMWEYNQEERSDKNQSVSRFEEDSVMASYVSNYRYRNWRESYDGDDDIKLDLSDLNDDDDDDDLEWDEDDDIENEYCDDPRQNPKSMEQEGKANAAEYGIDTESKHKQLQESQYDELNKSEANRSARKRNEYRSSVLNPVENLCQWKAMKSKPAKQPKNQKENIYSAEQEGQRQMPLTQQTSSNPFTSRTMESTYYTKPMHEIAVDASLSSWLI